MISFPRFAWECRADASRPYSVCPPGRFEYASNPTPREPDLVPTLCVGMQSGRFASFAEGA
ncbi:hypothetical protein [Desulfonema magnum]|uniref:hypothetical protein n=1 Tax=Desulfonema magnum TaxID=45655 RepID=UPI001A9AD15E|nr:hypothetical protein [Desulfonema magnum]